VENILSINNMKRFLSSIFLSVLFHAAVAQEALAPLQFHPKVNAASNAAFLHKKAQHRTASLALPFFDDFYQTEIYPDPALWQDNFVYINTTYPRKTVTIGVATFDGTNNAGQPYSLITTAYGEADRLTSNPIDLSGLTGDSSVFLSFYYIPGDYGEQPDPFVDSLMVQFRDTSGSWSSKWESATRTDSVMRQIFIKVDSQYLYADFQFRFLSIGSLNGANDTWHIDYVKLDKNRDTAVEANIKEMAYEFMPPSLLKPYYVMPYSQFDTTDQKDTVSVVVRNNFVNPTTDIVDFYDASVVNTGTPITSFSGPSRDFFPLTENVIDYPKFDIPLGLAGDTVVIRVDYKFTTSQEAGAAPKVLANDSVTHFQVFSNFFAYDDGSAERGYWVRGLENYKMAVKYGMRYPDTLQAIKLQFLPVVGDIGLAVFNICVWKNFSRNTYYNPDDLIYQQTNVRIRDLIAETGADTLNGYYYAPIKQQYVLNGATFPLVMSDTFAIGLIVQNKESLTVGFDRNNNRSSYNFYVDNDTKWRESDIAGTMIINPVVGKQLPPYLTPVREAISKQYDVKIYPNPARDELYVEGIRNKSMVEIYTIQGQLALQKEMNAPGYISIGNLANSTYVIKVTDQNTKQSGTSKFIKSE
jgi:hypothetical protein